MWSDPTAINGVPAYTDPALYDPNLMNGIQNGIPYVNGQRAPADQLPSNQLVRRSNNNQLTARDYGGYAPVGQNGWDNEDDEDLEAMALRARKEAQAKRKQIPPFVQKLSSFLDNSNHTDLIRWSDDGNSFIVLDEDEFAKTLIPELFKHNNYASFVRQLNMYGFHKKVGLSDNSMKQAERRDKKTPSEYFNKYFKRGRPELLWLIQKPKNPQSNSKRKREDDKKHDSDDEARKDADGVGIDSAAKDMQLISKSDYNTMRSEIRQLQQQQKLISGIIQQMRRQNEQWYQQASQFQKMHERHESSINAILTFLATFYNRSLEGQNGVNMNLADMFPSTLSQNNQNQGSVVDMGDYQDVDMSKKSPGPRPNKRPLALLPPPTAREAKSPSPHVSAQSPESSRPSVSSKGHQRSQSFHAPQQRPSRPRNLSTSPQVPVENNFTSAAPSPSIKAEASPGVPIPENSEDMMSVINSVNANSNNGTSGPQFDFPAALSHYQTADGNTPLTQQQREDMLSLMSAATPTMNGEANGTNNALINPQPPPMPTLEHFGAHQEQLDILQRLQEEQAARVANLSERLAPISPGGSIPGMTHYSSYNNQANAPPSDFDLDSFIHTDPDNYFPEGAPAATATNDDSNIAPIHVDNNFDFDFGNVDNSMSFSPASHAQQNLFGNDGASEEAENGGGRIVESMSSSGPNSPEENGDRQATTEPKSPRKKRKTG
ncbi:Heat shock factor (HSF)-type DNA-binding protein [Macrophomina phaseolina MS6]|uniref:Heat shock factor (HSF)-type DNA-binding protein n=2 Tax=Macrophomina phaseolina TaxID=35725 RepID=K2S0F7_MACPH|nr:Heat shock factor (HSF)-type DNA-binding protein [Macrophomina phaseolina MS6]